VGRLLDSPTLLVLLVILPVALVIWLVLWLARRSRRRQAMYAAWPAAGAPPGSVRPPPGWYSQADGSRRWWDGTEWTEHYRQPPEGL